MLRSAPPESRASSSRPISLGRIRVSDDPRRIPSRHETSIAGMGSDDGARRRPQPPSRPGDAWPADAWSERTRCGGRRTPGCGRLSLRLCDALSSYRPGSASCPGTTDRRGARGRRGVEAVQGRTSCQCVSCGLRVGRSNVSASCTTLARTSSGGVSSHMAVSVAPDWGRWLLV